MVKIFTTKHTKLFHKDAQRPFAKANYEVFILNSYKKRALNNRYMFNALFCMGA